MDISQARISGLRHIIALAVLLLAPAEHLYAASACGTPAYDPAQDSGIFVWQDCPSEQWHARFMSGGGFVRYTGTVESNLGFSGVTPVSIEPGDSFDYTTDPTTISYVLGMVAPWEDGFDFTRPTGASVCFGVDLPAGTPVFVGTDETQISTPFDLATLGPCSPPEPTLSINDVSVDEGAGTVSFTVRLAPASTGSVSVEYATSDVSATADSDYIPASGAVMFDPGDTAQLITVTILDDEEPQEGNETFHVNLGTPTNAALGDAVGVGTIVDNDGAAVCGAPVYDPSIDRKAFLWKDCNTGVWRARFAAGGGSFLQYKGTVGSDQAFTSVEPFSLESGDVLNTTMNPPEIVFQLGMGTRWLDGFDFSYPAGANVCFGVDVPAGTAVLVGPDRTPVAVPFDPETLGPCDTGPPPPPGDGYNFVVILTDDQRWDTLWAMPLVQEKLVNHGVNFTNAYITTPLCCPARASIYSGGFLAQNTGVLRNNMPNGGPDRFVDSETMPRLLQQDGYKTMFVGKYFALYAGYAGGVNVAPYVPPGWTKFVGRSVYATNRDWWQFRYTEGSTTGAPSVGTNLNAAGQYATSFERDQVLSFLDTVGNSNFFVLFSTSAPHPPATPAAGDENLFTDYTYRDRGYGETDLSDKPQWVVKYADWGGTVDDDALVRKQLQSLQEVDRAVGSIVDKVEAMGQLDRTVFIFLSDNGYMWGEHGLWAKGKPYEESVRIPLVIRTPDTSPRTEEQLVAANLDIGATIFDLTGIQKTTDGLSLVPLLNNPAVNFRDEVFLEGFGTGQGSVWAALRTDEWKLIDNPVAGKELYDMVNDPYELESRHNDPDPLYQNVLADMSARLDTMKGINLNTFKQNIPSGNVGSAYSVQLKVWGGTPPYTWTVSDGALPAGLSLNPSTGRISGTPTKAGTAVASIMVEGSGVRSYTGLPERFISDPFSFVINP